MHVAHLDEEYRHLLKEIRPHITTIDSPYILTQYRVWLEELSNPELTDKRKRNVYLRELANQIKQETLWYPFTEHPNYCFVSDIDREAQGDFNRMSRSGKYKSLPRNVFSAKGFHLADENSNHSKKATKVVVTRRPKSCRPCRNKHSQVNIKNTAESLENLPTSSNPSYMKMMENVQNVKELFDYHKLETASWLDMSESNSTRSSVEINIQNTNVAESLDKESSRPDSDEDRISNKILSKDANVIVTDLKKTIECLQLRLTETIKQNNDLKCEMSMMTKRDDTDLSRKAIPELDVEKLIDMQDENSRRLEDLLQSKLSQVEKNFQAKLDDMTVNYETRINTIAVEKAVNLMDKELEIVRLNEIIEKQCLKMSNEITMLRAQMVESNNANNCDDKVAFLQKCVAKMDRLFHKIERDYQKQIDKLKHGLAQKEKSMQILLKSQRVEVMSKACAEKQSQFDLMVNSLEIKYIKMFEIQSQQFMATKEKHEKKIEYLKQLLDKHSIAYEHGDAA